MIVANKPLSGELGFPWYVAHTKPRQERVALENLARQGYGVYLPLLKVLNSRRNMRQVGFEALFPRYIFFQLRHSEHSIAPVRSTKGVTTIVGFGGVPAVLRADTLQSIRAFEKHQNAADLKELSDLCPGKTVVVTSGPLAGVEGLVSMVSRKRVIVLMHLLGAQTQVRLNLDQLKLAA